MPASWMTEYPTIDFDDAVFPMLFSSEGAVQLLWEVATPCPNVDPATQQPVWDCPQCAGSGVLFAPAVSIFGLFRSQSRWLSFRAEGEFDHGEATLTTPLDVCIGYTDRRVRDRLTVVSDVGDLVRGRVFYPSSPSTPFNFNNVQRAWRVQVQSATQADRLVPQ
jgi:hypothetical protein